jgi:DNA invertase Pin-like site-specific DNA recombinase
MNIDRYAMYLRKSRADIELETQGGGDTLARHRSALLALAAHQHLTVTDIFEEVVSGETIAARPKMQQLLSAVEQREYAGVLVMEVERLARGDTIDQGIVAQAFKYSDTKIITPTKTYDPNNEFDEEYFEFGLFMSRREYNTINRRLQRGRMASINEGKFVGNKAPYGYRRVKLSHEKGFTLEPVPEQAQWVQQIFAWYTSPTEYPAGQLHRLGQTLIANRLNAMGIPSATGGSWTAPVIRSILENPVYIGKVRWNNRANKKAVENGIVKITRPRSKEAIVKQGLHPAIVEESVFDLAQTLLRHPSKPGPKQVEILNPLAGIIVCAQCGHNMVRRPYQSGRQAALLCAYNDCHGTVASDLTVVEDALLDAMETWLVDFEMQISADTPTDTSSLDAALSALDKEIAQLNAQEEKAYDLVETGVYSTEVFLSRTRSIAERRAKIEKQSDSLRSERDNLVMLHNSRVEFLPKLRHVLDVYPSSSPKQKNELLKTVLDKCEYRKTNRDRWKGGSDMQLTLYPKLPK